MAVLDYSVFDRAIKFAVDAHAGQLRKDGSTYILHPMEVAAIAGTMTQDPDVLAAAVLHDTVEDTAVTADDILAAFGPRVAEFVAHDTEDKHPEMDSRVSWRLRKEESLAALKENGSREAQILWVADKVSNMRVLARDYAVLGEKVFDRFNETDPKQQRWYHATVLAYTAPLQDCAAYREYERLFHQVFDDYE